MRLISLVFILFFFISCNVPEEIMHYEYNQIRITRINIDKKAFFYYGNCNNKDVTCNEASVIVDWSFDDFLFGFLLFHPDGTVEIINGGGGKFQKARGNSKVFIKDYTNLELQTILSSYKSSHNYDNLFQLSDNPTLEKNRNFDFKSNVKLTYGAK